MYVHTTIRVRSPSTKRLRARDCGSARYESHLLAVDRLVPVAYSVSSFPGEYVAKSIRLIFPLDTSRVCRSGPVFSRKTTATYEAEKASSTRPGCASSHSFRYRTGKLSAHASETRLSWQPFGKTQKDQARSIVWLIGLGRRLASDIRDTELWLASTLWCAWTWCLMFY